MRRDLRTCSSDSHKDPNPLRSPSRVRLGIAPLGGARLPSCPAVRQLIRFPRLLCLELPARPSFGTPNKHGKTIGSDRFDSLSPFHREFFTDSRLYHMLRDECNVRKRCGSSRQLGLESVGPEMIGRHTISLRRVSCFDSAMEVCEVVFLLWLFISFRVGNLLSARFVCVPCVCAYRVDHVVPDFLFLYASSGSTNCILMDSGHGIVTAPISWIWLVVILPSGEVYAKHLLISLFPDTSGRNEAHIAHLGQSIFSRVHQAQLFLLGQLRKLKSFSRGDHQENVRGDRAPRNSWF